MRVQPIQTKFLTSPNIKSLKQQKQNFVQNKHVSFNGILPKGITIWDVAISGILASATGGVGGVAYLAGKKALYELSKREGNGGNHGPHGGNGGNGG